MLASQFDLTSPPVCCRLGLLVVVGTTIGATITTTIEDLGRGHCGVERWGPTTKLLLWWIAMLLTIITSSKPSNKSVLVGAPVGSTSVPGLVSHGLNPGGNLLMRFRQQLNQVLGDILVLLIEE